MHGPYLRKYGEAATFDFVLFATDGVDFKSDAVHASGDTTIMKDEGAEANTTNGFTDEGQGYSIVLTTTEMEAARIVVYVADQATKTWLDTALIIETYGHASAQHAFDLDTATVALSSATETQIDNIEGDTNELQTDWHDGGRLDLILDAASAPSAATVADAVWDEATADHATGGTMGKALADAGSDLGVGAITFTYTLTDAATGDPITSAKVWVTTDQAGQTTPIASGTTDSSGQITFYLDAGTVYVWRAKAGWNFTNPDTETVA